DTQPTYYPGAGDVWYDGLDTNCDGRDDFDQDLDGFRSSSYGGTDCNDLNNNIRPTAVEIWYDGVDQNCDSLSDYDQDYDGFDADTYGGTDCADTRATIYPGAAEVRDGLDNDCDAWYDEYLINAGDVLITEIMKDPSISSDPTGEWFELYNNTSTTIVLADWTVSDNAGTITIPSTVSIPSRGYVIIAAANTSRTVEAYVYGTILQLNNGADNLNVATAWGTAVDDVYYDNGVTFPDPVGASITLDPDRYDATLNNLGQNWCTATTAFATSGSITEYGTPGSANDSCTGVN
ncbi:MAG TPA: MopE-related protein, partial [Myxococcota bacterium]|nr:MopE-related protein [Myxococcota bacterium]